jgi:predicted nucleic acid-binding Zn ribbon protein
MAMDKIDKILTRESRYKRFQKPLEAANICAAGASCVDARYNIVSFRNGVLAVGVRSSAEAANLQMKSGQILECVNKKLGKEIVKRLRYKITNSK